MTKHYPKINNSKKSTLAEECGNGTCSTMIGKNIFTINLPRTISDLMSIEHGVDVNSRSNYKDILRSKNDTIDTS